MKIMTMSARNLALFLVLTSTTPSSWANANTNSNTNAAAFFVPTKSAARSGTIQPCWSALNNIIATKLVPSSPPPRTLSSLSLSPLFNNSANNRSNKTWLKSSTKEEEQTASEKSNISPITKISMSPASSSTSTSTSSPNMSTKKKSTLDPISCTKFTKLKDRMWVREALEDITAAEFACSIGSMTKKSNDEDEEDDTTNGNNNDDDTPQKKTKRAVDFDNILIKLDRRLEDMCTRTTVGEAKVSGAIVCYPLQSSKIIDDEDVTKGDERSQECYSLQDNVGMASVTYTFEQRDALVVRFLETREKLIVAMSGKPMMTSSSSSITTTPTTTTTTTTTDLDDIREQLKTTDSDDDTTTKSSSSTTTSSSTSSSNDPYLYVRDDGTVDWDGALQDRAALKKFGTSVWARINGEDPENVDEDTVNDSPSSAGGHGHDKKPVTAKIADTEAIRSKKERLDILKNEYNDMNMKHTALLSSAVQKGSTVANVNLALLEPELRLQIRSSTENLDRKKNEVTFQTLNYELERIYTYLDGELGNTATKGYIPLSDRLNVAEFGLLESQIENLNQQLANDGGDVVDADVLSVVMDQTNDFKRRLGIDYYVAGLTFDQEAIKIWLSEIVEKSKDGFAFYGKGCQLFWNDIIFSFSLIGRALQGYTLKPREVRTLRRTFKDVITFIPFIIIWLIPLTPVGHVLIFGAIQRVYPDFFPSSFTERRQNLLELYETAEFSALTIDENWQEKIGRYFTAIAYTLADGVKKAFTNAEEETKTKS